MPDEICSEIVSMVGHEGDPVEAYFTRPVGGGSVPGVVVVHHMPGWDEWTRAVTFKLAVHGFAAIAPHLYSRLGPGRWDDLAAAARAQGGVPDAQVVGDIEGAAAFLRSRPDSNGKVGVFGFCSGGRHAYCGVFEHGARRRRRLLGRHVVMPPEDLTRVPAGVTVRADAGPALSDPRHLRQRRPVPVPGRGRPDRGRAPPVRQGLRVPSLRRRGARVLRDGTRKSYRPEQAVDGWEKVFAFYRDRLGAPTKT